MVDRVKYKQNIHNVERDLKNYPYWLIAIETPGLGSATRWDIVCTDKYTGGSSKLEDIVFQDLERQRKVDAITGVKSKLDDITKELIEKWYFNDMYTRENLIRELNINKNEFYRLRDKALKKFMIALKYI